MTSVAKTKTAENAEKRPGQFSLAWRRFSRNKAAVVSLCIIFLIILAAIFADYLTPYAFDAQNPLERMQYPSLAHPLGTDDFGPRPSDPHSARRAGLSAGGRHDGLDFYRSISDLGLHGRLLWRRGG